MRFRTAGRCVLQRNIDVGTNLVVGRDGFEQPRRDFVGICVEKANPAQVFNPGQFLQQKRQAIFQAKILAVTGRVLADQRDFAHAGVRQSLGLGDRQIQNAASEIFRAAGE